MKNNSRLVIGKNEYNGKSYHQLTLYVELNDGNIVTLLVKPIISKNVNFGKLMCKLEHGLKDND